MNSWILKNSMGSWGLFDQRKSLRWDVILSHMMQKAVRRGAVDLICVTPKGRARTMYGGHGKMNLRPI